MSSAPDGTLRAAPIMLSRQNGNQYQQIGTLPIVALRKSGNLIILILNQNKQPVVALPVVPTIDWAIQNEVYCTFVDSRSIRWLVQFQSSEEAYLFTCIALSQQLMSKKLPICVSKSDAEPIDASQSLIVNFSAYDLFMSKIENPIRKEENYDIPPSETSPIKSVIPNGNYGSVFLIEFAPNVIAVVKVLKRDISSLNLPGLGPPTPAAAPKEAAPSKPAEITQQVDDTPKKIAEPELKAAEPIKKPDEPQESQLKKAQEPEKKVQHTNVEGNTTQLSELRDEMNKKFENLLSAVSSLRRMNLQQQSVASDVLSSSVQRLCNENREKDALIAEKQQLIDLLSERKTDTRERDELRKQLAEMTEKLSAHREAAKAKAAKCEELKKEVEDLHLKLVKTNIETQANIDTVKRECERDRIKQQNDLAEAKKQLEASIESSKKELDALKEKCSKLNTQNEALKTRAKKDYGAELAKMKAALPNVIQNAVQRMARGTFEMIQQTFDADQKFDGATVIKGAKIALQREAQEIVEELEPEEGKN